MLLQQDVEYSERIFIICALGLISKHNFLMRGMYTNLNFQLTKIISLFLSSYGDSISFPCFSILNKNRERIVFLWGDEWFLNPWALIQTPSTSFFL